MPFEVGLARHVYTKVLGTLQGLRDQKGAAAWRVDLTQLGKLVVKYMVIPLMTEDQVNLEDMQDE